MCKDNGVDISGFSVEDFVLNREFRIWVLFPGKSTNIHWDKLLKENPGQISKAKVAREIVLNLSYRKESLTENESTRLWELIDAELDDLGSESEGCEIVPISPVSILKRCEIPERRFFRYSQWIGVAAILVLAFTISLGVNLVYYQEMPVAPVQLLVYEEHFTPPGVKSTMTLQDGSKVMLNSGSSLRYIKNFETDRRVVHLSGEAYFEVAKDSLRPFTVIAGGVMTTALGTAFNVSAYEKENINVSLVEGRVAVESEKDHTLSANLTVGEELSVNLETGKSQKGNFNPDMVLAWTNKKIIFQKAKMDEAIRVLENWYGVKFKLKNEPAPGLLVYGEYEDEILENILEGLSYSARFEYKIQQDEVEIFFR